MDAGKWLLGILLVLALGLGLVMNRGQSGPQEPRAQFKDATPLGGRGLALVLNKLGYTAKLQTEQLNAIPGDARVWMILDPHTRFTRREADILIGWVQGGGTLIWAITDNTQPDLFGNEAQPTNAGRLRLTEAFGVHFQDGTALGSTSIGLPVLSSLGLDAVTVYRTGVKKAQASSNMLTIDKPYLEIAGGGGGAQIGRIDMGRGRVFLVPDALLFTNYALSKPDNAVLVTNLIRAHEKAGAVYFDEREIDEVAADKFQASLAYYLWRPPLRYAWIQLAVAGLLLWILATRRLGAAVPLPEGGPVTRASQFAAAMGALFLKANRPKAAGQIIGDNFRRQLAKRLGMSPADPDLALAKRAHELSGLPVDLVDRLLLQTRAPATNEAEVLRDAQEMEYVLRRLNVR
jgi:hypothetical protein